MTTFAYREVVAAERPLSVMTTHATKRAARGVMVQRLRRRHISSPHAMTISATEPVLRMTETDAEGTSRLTRPRKATELVTHAARRDIAIA